MDKSGSTGRHKAKNKKTEKTKTAKKRKSDGPTCSTFLAELTRKLAHNKNVEEDSPRNIVQTIIKNITSALPIKFSKTSPKKIESPIEIENLQALAPELLPYDTLEIPPPISETSPNNYETTDQDENEIIPKMPVTNSDVFKMPPSKKRKVSTEDAAVNTSGSIDIAGELAKHVGTLRKISIIAEEFNQKTAKNLKEIVDSVQKDLITKMEELKKEEKLKAVKQHLQEKQQQLAIQ